MERVILVAPDRGRCIRLRREIRRMGLDVLQVAEAAGVDPVVKEARNELLVLDAGIQRPSETLALVRGIRRRHRRVGIILVGTRFGRGLENSLNKLDIPCLLEPIQGALLRACVRGTLEKEVPSVGRRPRGTRKDASAGDSPAPGPTHDIDDLWFEILDRAARRSRGSEE